jgi:large conductance mechanosensitive channel
MTIVSFIIIAAVIFFFIVRPIAQMHARQKAAEAAPAPDTKECPFCYTNISIKATRCPNCTSELKEV